jgi:Xaa-Pro aminopeptidase
MRRHLLFTLLLYVLSLFQVASQECVIKPSEYKARRTRLKEGLKDGIIILTSGKLYKDNLMFGALSVSNLDFYYLVGIHFDKAILFIDPTKDEEILFVRASKRRIKKARECSGIKEIHRYGRFEKFIKKRLVGAERVYIKQRDGALIKKIRKINKKIEIRRQLGREIAKLRVVKSASEVKLIKKAVEAVGKGFIKAMQKIKPGMNEADLEKIFRREIKKNRCQRFAYPPIIASGKNAIILHYNRNNRQMKKGEWVVCDVGAEYNMYASDVTRTIPVSGKFSKQQRKIYQAVLDALKSAEKELKPGATFFDLHRAASEVLSKKGFADVSFAKKHFIGHFVGLCVHDVVPARNIKFKPGMVITIEPGIYDVRKKVGIRIEDLYLITQNGFERLSKDIPREIEEIEKISRRKNGKRHY